MKLLKKILNSRFKKRSSLDSSPGVTLKGDKVHCVCCNGNFTSFLPFGLVKRPNALCPNCGSLERHRLHWHYMIHQTNLFKSPATLRVLHVAPETVLYNKFINDPRFDYVPCAKFGPGYEDTYPPGTINQDITRMDFEDSSFDIIYCSHVLEHIPDDKKAMKEIYRVLKPGGWAMLQVPLDTTRETTYEDFSIIKPSEREEAFGQADHVRVYGKDYGKSLSGAGFLVNVENYIKQFSEKEIFKNGFTKNEDIFICSKI